MQLAKPSWKPRRLTRQNPTVRLPPHLMGLVTLAQAKRGSEIAGEVLNLLDVGDERLIDGLLVRCPGARNLLLL